MRVDMLRDNAWGGLNASMRLDVLRALNASMRMGMLRP